MEQLPHYYFYWIVSFQKQRYICDMLPLEIKPLNRGGKLENLKKEMQKNEVSVLGASKVRWKGQGEIRSGDYTVIIPEVNGLKKVWQ